MSFKGIDSTYFLLGLGISLPILQALELALPYPSYLVVFSRLLEEKGWNLKTISDDDLTTIEIYEKNSEYFYLRWHKMSGNTDVTLGSKVVDRSIIYAETNDIFIKGAYTRITKEQFISEIINIISSLPSLMAQFDGFILQIFYCPFNPNL